MRGQRVNSAVDRDADIRARIQQHWEASERGDVDAEHAIYAAEAILDYPQSGERFRGRSRIQAQRGGHPAERHFTIHRIPGGGDLWVSECVITAVVGSMDDIDRARVEGPPVRAPAGRRLTRP